MQVHLDILDWWPKRNQEYLCPEWACLRSPQKNVRIAMLCHSGYRSIFQKMNCGCSSVCRVDLRCVIIFLKFKKPSVSSSTAKPGLIRKAALCQTQPTFTLTDSSACSLSYQSQTFLQSWRTLIPIVPRARGAGGQSWPCAAQLAQRHRPDLKLSCLASPASSNRWHSRCAFAVNRAPQRNNPMGQSGPNPRFGKPNVTLQ